jgi:hypothetical protein
MSRQPLSMRHRFFKRWFQPTDVAFAGLFMVTMAAERQNGPLSGDLGKSDLNSPTALHRGA